MRLTLFLSLLLSAVLSTMAQTAVVTGSVVDADTGSPIPGAVVTIPDQGISVTTGPAGDFRISKARASTQARCACLPTLPTTSS